jgi:predicted RNase H-like HicB family nuclease
VVNLPPFSLLFQLPRLLDSTPVRDYAKTMARNRYTAVTEQDGKWWIGWIEEIPGVNCQEPTREELLVSLRETLAEAIELNRQDAIRAASANYTEEPVTV